MVSDNVVGAFGISPGLNVLVVFTPALKTRPQDLRAWGCSKTLEPTFLAICRLSIITIWNAGVHCALVVADAAMVSSCCTLA
jgi:hypothetical protein